MEGKKPTTSTITVKPYRCNRCGNESRISTNHWGEVYSRCNNCSWKYPFESNSHICLEVIPEGYQMPEPWVTVKLGDIMEITPGNRQWSTRDDSTGKPHEVEVGHMVGSLPECQQCVVARKGRS